MINLIRRLIGATEHEEERRELLSRREFGRRIFAIGAGFAVGGALIRQATWRDVLDYAEPVGPYTATSALADIYKKVHRDMVVAFRTRVEEYDWFDDLPDVGTFRVSKDYEITLEPPRPVRMIGH